MVVQTKDESGAVSEQAKEGDGGREAGLSRRRL